MKLHRAAAETRTAEQGSTPPDLFCRVDKAVQYDDDGYVTQWWRGFVPSNSLSTLYGLAQSSSSRRILGRDIEIKISTDDETTTAIPIKRIIRRLRRTAIRTIICVKPFRAATLES
jgi:hypothetical protein